MQQRFYRFLVVIGLAAVAMTGCQQEVPSYTEAERPIVNGNIETGWMGVGALTYQYPGYGYAGSFCTGALITPQWVLTAGHCLTGVQSEGFVPTPQITMFYVGNDATPGFSGWPSSGALYQADAFYIHPDYSDQYNENDLGLVHLAEPVSGTAPYPINSSFLSSITTPPFYVGFGATEGINHSGGGIKRSTSFAVSEVYQDVFVSDFTGTNICYGDSGGPSFLQLGGEYKIIGVNSALSGCPDGDPTCPADPCHMPSISTRVDAYADWISAVSGSPLPNCNSTPSVCFCAAACQPDGSCNLGACQTQTCEETYDCLAACDGTDAACPAVCYASGTDQGKADLDAMWQCFDDMCPGLEGSAFSDCAWDNCQTQIETCLPVGTGPLSCHDVYFCIGGCPDGDDACVGACFEQGTAAAQDQYNAMVECYSANCASGGDPNCLSNQCGSQELACFPPGSLSCEEVQDCYVACPDGDSLCMNGCYYDGSSEARQYLDALVDCSATFCSGETGSAWQTCMSNNCSDPIADCFPPSNCAIYGGECPAGEACYPLISGGTECFPSDGLADGAQCTPSGQGQPLPCGDGLICWTGGAGIGVCTQMCVVDLHCTAPMNCSDPIFQDNDEIGRCVCTDGDQDGYCEGEDCDDGAAGVNPGADETCDDSIDNDCDGMTDEACGCLDADGDDFCVEDDCNDGDATINPAAAEVCDDGVDNDCDSLTDEDCGGPGEDTGGPGEDAGGPGEDSGGPGEDTGPVPVPDSGGPGSDPGGTDTGGTVFIPTTPDTWGGGGGTSSSGCATGRPAPTGWTLGGLLLLLLGLAMRRRG